METLLLGRNNLQPYTGEVHPPRGYRNKQGQMIYPYLPSKELVEAVNLAITLQRPLLLQGEPGCGKTKLAQAVAYELDLPYIAWTIKSTSRAQDGLYTYNSLAQLRDTQISALNPLGSEKRKLELEDPTTYREWGPVGRAFKSAKPTVLLIDEIDKADIDFPNDLLLELDEKRFTVPETGEEVMAQNPPVIFITSNQERDLPDAFLRRCIFKYIDFPSPDDLINIIIARFWGVPKDEYDIPDECEYEFMEKIVRRFIELRSILQQEKGRSSKNVTTSELLDWFDILRRHPQDEILKELDGKLPYLGVLLKTWDDYRRYIKRVES